MFVHESQDRYAPSPYSSSTATEQIAITLTRAEWISIRSAIGSAASKEEAFSKSVKDRLLSYQSKESAKRLRNLDIKIKNGMSMARK